MNKDSQQGPLVYGQEGGSCDLSENYEILPLKSKENQRFEWYNKIDHASALFEPF